MSTNFDALIGLAKQSGASDLHLEAGLPAALRVRGALRMAGEPVSGPALAAFAHELIGAEHWPFFLERRSFDLSRTIQGVRCRINVLHTARGIGLAVRLLASFQATIEKLNLHPDLKRFVGLRHGLVIITGATGSGKSSTLAALIQEINLTEARHIVTIESPIEYTFRPRHAFIRQREVGRDTPSFYQALLDALREDPDVLMVGEMRDPETMRLTLNAAETGHLVLATMHSANCAEALQRIVAAFPAEIQGSVAAQLADCLAAVICQRLHFRTDLNLRVPECEILVPTFPIKNFIRTREFFKLMQTMETGAEQGMWTFARYQTWLNNRRDWHRPEESPDAPDSEAGESASLAKPLPPPIPTGRVSPPTTKPGAPAGPKSGKQPGGPIEIEPIEGGLDAVLRKLG